MSDQNPTGLFPEPEPTIADLIAGTQPMGDLRRFVIEDMTADEEDEFFTVLDNV